MIKACGLALSLTAVVTVAGCARLQQPTDNSSYQTQTVSAAWYQKVTGQQHQLMAENQRLQKELAASKKSAVSKKSAAKPEPSSALSIPDDDDDDSDLPPPNAKPGACYARVKIPAVYHTQTEKVLVSPQSVNVSTEPATFHSVKKRVLVHAAYDKLKLIPATYKTVSQRVKVRDATTRLKTVPAKYKSKTKKVVVRPAYTEWRKGSGRIVKMNDSTGEIMHLVTVPPKYRTLTTKELVSPEHTVSVKQPAVYKTVQQQVVDQPAHTVKVKVPAVYKTVNVVEQATPPKERKQVVPAIYQQVPKRVLVSKAHMGWAEILCKKDTTRSVLIHLQAALKVAGYDPHAVDGIMGSNTRKAMAQYQKDRGMPAGLLTLATLKKLGVEH